jgi:ribA/ribD-fused uncharacterized protein
MMKEIRFKYSNDNYGFLSNFYKRIFIVDGIKWKTSEHYYQYKKLKFLQELGEPVTDEFLLEIINSKTAKEVKMLGHTKFNQIDMWDEIKIDEMKNVLRMKFKIPFLKQCLINTENAILIEDNTYDNFWANGRNNKGLNMLGKCLMEIRDELNNE